MHSLLPPMVTLALLSGALSGCFGGKNPDARCDDVEEYQLNASVPDLTVPDGLTAPSRDPTYLVPAENGIGAAELEARGAACLARPPDYFRRDPAAAPAKPAAPPAN